MAFKVKNDLPTKAQHAEPQVLCLQLFSAVKNAKYIMQQLLIKAGHEPSGTIGYIAGLFEAVENRMNQLDHKFNRGAKDEHIK